MSTAAVSTSARAAVTARAAATAPTAVQAHSQPRLRLTRRGRLVLAALIALPFAVIVGFFALSGGGAIASNGGPLITFEYVQVASGQSLWQLAGAIAPDADPREVVSDIVHLNRLASADVHPGQQLAVPTAYSE